MKTLRLLTLSIFIPLCLLWSSPVAAQMGSVPYVFTSGTTIRSSDMNALFSDIYSRACNRAGCVLTATATTLTLLPTADNVSDIGSAALSYNDAWFDGTLTVATFVPTTVTCTGCITSTNVLDGTLLNADINSAAAIALSKLATFSSSDLAGRLTDESGTGVVAYTTSPSFTTPTLGVAVATTLDTGQGANELYDMDQNVLMTSNVTFAAVGVDNNGLLIEDTGGDHSLTFSVGTNFSTGRVLTFTPGDANRTITLSGNPTLADWFDQAVKSTSSPTFVTVTAALTGNAATATALQTARAINGVNFDGTAAITVTVPVATGITGLGTGVATALAVNVGSAGAPVLFNGAGGTPSSITLTNGTSLPWSGVSKSGSSLADLATRAVANLSDGSNVALLTGAAFTGQVTISGSTAEQLSVSTTANNYAARINGNGATGSSFGLLIDAGTNASDFAFNVRSKSGAAILMNLTGAGVLSVYNSGANFATDLKVLGAEGGSATLYLYSDEGDDGVDQWQFAVDASGILSIDANSSSVMIISPSTGNVTIPSLMATSGTRYVCSNTQGTLVDTAAACSGTDADAIASIPTLLARIEALEAQLGLRRQ